MDLVSLLFCQSWLHATLDGACDKHSDPFDDDRFHRMMDGGPDWRGVLGSLAIIAVLVLAGALFPASI